MSDHFFRKPLDTTAAVNAAPETFLADAAVFGTSESVELQERTGQEELLRSYALPADMRPSREPFEQLGVRFDAGPMPDDQIFIAARLPEGWTRRAKGDTPYWTELVDEHGTARVSIFYKAAYYDRRAFMSIEASP